MATTILKKKTDYWYKYTHYVCPTCGSSNGDFKEKITTRKKPKSESKRHTYIESYDFCVERKKLGIR